MACCLLIATLLAVLIRPFRAFRRSTAPLAWRPHAVEAAAVAEPPLRSSISARIASFGYAIEGLRYLVRNEPNARIHVVAGVLAIIVGILLNIGAAEWRWIALAIALVFAAEALNTAIEQVCNLVSPRPDPLVKVAKDVAAGAVLVCAVTAAAIGVATFAPYLPSLASSGTTVWQFAFCNGRSVVTTTGP